MYNILMNILFGLCVLIILAVVMQPSKSNAANSLSGGSEELFARRKARGFEAFMQRVTYVLLAAFFIVTTILMYLTYKGI